MAPFELFALAIEYRINFDDTRFRKMNNTYLVINKKLFNKIRRTPAFLNYCLISAVELSDINLLKKVYSHGGDIYFRDNYPFRLAIVANKADVLRYFFSINYIYIMNENLEDFICRTAVLGSIKSVQVLIENNVLRDKDYFELIIGALLNQKSEMIHLLWQKYGDETMKARLLENSVITNDLYLAKQIKYYLR